MLRPFGLIAAKTLNYLAFQSFGLSVRDEEEFEDTKGVIRIRISEKNRQHNGQKKKYKGIDNDLQNIQIKLKVE
jgi:hypothetical protein